MGAASRRKKEAASQERQFYRTDPCAKFAYEEMMISAKLSLAVE